jgi:2-hydroxy-3-oxopropionate reductase
MPTMTESKPTVAVIGLGIMGAPMAANLVKAGYEVVGYNRSRGKVDALVDAGGRGAGSIAEAAQTADVIITMLPDSPDVEGAALGEDGLIAHAKSGATWIDCSSIRPDVAVTVAKAATDAGVKAIDAPVSGGEQGAKEATLSIMVGGEAEDVEAVRPVLEAVGKTIVHVGPSGSGQTVKAANQLIVAGNYELVAEAIVFLRAYGVDTEAALKVLAGGLAGSTVLNRKGASMLAGQFAPGFRIDLHHKDMGIVLESARAKGVTIPLGALTAQLISALRAQGDGGLDHSALLRGVERLSGQEVSGQ